MGAGQCTVLPAFPMVAQRDDWCSFGNITRVASASNINEKKIFNPFFRSDKLPIIGALV
jgi:hypothetical protein